MRIRVKDVLDLLAAGVGEREILEDYPYLEPEDIRACLEFAAAQALSSKCVPSPAVRSGRSI